MDRCLLHVGFRALLLFALVPSLVEGQTDHERFTEHASVVGANVAIGGITSGILRKVRGGSFWEGARQGAVGGGLAYAGKRVSVGRWQGAGFVGRELSALGSSLVYRGGAPGDSLLAMLPAGPLHVYVRRHADGVRTQVKLNLAATVLAVVAAAKPGARWDAGASLSSGALVWRRENWDRPSLASELGGVIFLRDDWESRQFYHAGFESAVFAHERVHVAQDDFAFLAWIAPLERRLWRHLPGGRLAVRYVDLGLNVPLVWAVNAPIAHSNRPWEREAGVLSGVR